MGIEHKAYTFDPHSFHRQLVEKIVVGNVVDFIRFQEYIREVVQYADSVTIDVLNYMRFDEEWLDRSGDIWSGDEWYAIALAASLTEAPSLSNRLQVSYRVLEMSLPIIGWRSNRIAKLLTGDNLSSLMSTSQCPPLIQAFSGSIQYGGWISNDQVNIFKRLLHDTLSTKERLNHILVMAISDWCTSIGVDPGYALNAAFEDANDMINTAMERGDALYVTLRD